MSRELHLRQYSIYAQEATSALGTPSPQRPKSSENRPRCRSLSVAIGRVSPSALPPLCGVGRIVRRTLVIVKPDVVRFRDIRQPVDGIQHLRQAPLVLLVHGSQQIPRLRQGFVAFGKLRSEERRVG